MRPIDVKSLKYRDNLASKRRQRFQVKAGLIGLVAVAVIAAIGYGLFYASWLRVTTVNITGLSPDHEQEVRDDISLILNERTLGVPVNRNILFFPENKVAKFTASLTFLQSIHTSKKLPHTLTITASERQLEGIWCYNPPAGECRYFDHNGVTWGQAAQSSGSLVLNVDDMRTPASSSLPAVIDQSFLGAIQTVVPALTQQGVAVKKVIIPAGSFTEFDAIVTEGYPLKFSLDSDIPGQLDVYRIFRTQKASIPDFHPQYIDLRFDGRVYYK